MIFKHCLNITTILIIGTTCGTTVAMKRKHEELKLEYRESKYTQLAVAAGNTAYPKSGFPQSMKNSYSELTHDFENAAPTTYTFNIKGQETKLRSSGNCNRSPEITFHENFYEKTHKENEALSIKEASDEESSDNPKYRSKITFHENFYEVAHQKNLSLPIKAQPHNRWTNDLTNGPQIPKNVQDTILLELTGKTSNYISCHFGTLITLRYQQLKTGKKLTQLIAAASLLHRKTRKPLKRNYIKSTLLNIKKQNPKIESMLQDLVKTQKVAQSRLNNS